MDYAAVAKQLPPPPAPAPQPVSTLSAAAVAPPPPPPSDEPRLTLDDLYVEVKAVAGSRDLISEDPGQLTVRSAKKGMGVMLEGKAVSRQLPFTLKLPPGEYELRTIEAGRKLSERRIRIKANTITELDLQ